MHHFTNVFYTIQTFFEDHPPLASIVSETWKRLQLSVVSDSSQYWTTEKAPLSVICWYPKSFLSRWNKSILQSNKWSFLPPAPVVYIRQILSSCSSHTTDTAPGLQLHTELWQQAKSHFETSQMWRTSDRWLFISVKCNVVRVHVRFREQSVLTHGRRKCPGGHSGTISDSFGAASLCLNGQTVLSYDPASNISWTY